ncbi:MAG: PaaI family thioesterase [Burkholderiaceae bacterium]
MSLFVPDIPFAQHVGLRVVDYREGRSLLEVEPGPHHQNSRGVVHGGLLTTMIDVAMAMAARSLSEEPQQRETNSVTIEMKVSFIRAGVGKLRAEGRCVHKTASLLFCEADVLDEDGELVARGSGTFKLLRRRSAST